MRGGVPASPAADRSRDAGAGWRQPAGADRRGGLFAGPRNEPVGAPVTLFDRRAGDELCARRHRGRDTPSQPTPRCVLGRHGQAPQSIVAEPPTRRGGDGQGSDRVSEPPALQTRRLTGAGVAPAAFVVSGPRSPGAPPMPLPGNCCVRSPGTAWSGAPGAEPGGRSEARRRLQTRQWDEAAGRRRLACDRLRALASLEYSG
jgi:hypothetical protein